MIHKSMCPDFWTHIGKVTVGFISFLPATINVLIHLSLSLSLFLPFPFIISSLSVPSVSLSKLRDEVTKLKFEAKTFHIYANQKEVCACINTMLPFLHRKRCELVLLCDALRQWNLRWTLLKTNLKITMRKSKVCFMRWRSRGILDLLDVSCSPEDIFS